jgi:hypothetical protein
MQLRLKEVLKSLRAQVKLIPLRLRAGKEQFSHLPAGKEQKV